MNEPRRDEGGTPFLCRVFGHKWVPVDELRYEQGRTMAFVGGIQKEVGVTWVCDEVCSRCGGETVVAGMTKPVTKEDGRVTHGRHCTCSACAREDWTNPKFVCGMHGPDCPNVYAPLGSAGREYERPE